MIQVLLYIKCVLSYSSKWKSGSSLVTYQAMCCDAGWVSSEGLCSFTLLVCFQLHPVQVHILGKEIRYTKTSGCIEPLPVSSSTAICTAVIIINTLPHKFQQIKSCYFILSALSFLCAAKSPAHHLFWLIFIEMRFKDEPVTPPEI